MDTVNGYWKDFKEQCVRTVQWRSALTVPYIMAVNAIFWCAVFYGSREAQMRYLAASALLIFCNDVLLCPTYERSIIVQIIVWPFQPANMWKTIAVTLCGIGIHQLGEDNEEEALWCSAGAASCVLISPVYQYHDVNGQICKFFLNIGSFVKNTLTYYIIRPILYAYDFMLYIVLLKWWPGLCRRVSAALNNLGDTFDSLVVSRFRYLRKRMGEIFSYWIYMQWVTDLRGWAYKRLGIPIIERLKVVRDYLVYVFGGYWFAPMLRSFGHFSLQISCLGFVLLRNITVSVTSSFVWPLVVTASEHLRSALKEAYDVCGRPVVDATYEKYKVGEDFVLINFVGPMLGKVIESIPEKNPFCDDTDDELAEFIPRAVEDAADDNVVEEIKQPRQRLPTDSDLDDIGFLDNRLQQHFSGSDSSDEEFGPVFRRRPVNA